MAYKSKLPRGWKESRIDEIADVSFSSVDKKSIKGQKSVRLCNYMDVWKNSYIHRGLSFMEATASDIEIERFTLSPGDVLLTKDSETKEEIAEPAVVWEKIENLILGYHLALLHPHERVTDGPFLAAQLRIPEFRSQFIRAASGATRYGLSMDTVCGAKVWSPPYKIQTKISGIIRSIDEVIESTRSVIDQTLRLKTALLQDILTNGLPGRHKKFKSHKTVGRIPAEWRVKPLAEIADVIDCKHRTPIYQDQGYPVVRPGDVKEGKLDLTQSPRTSKKEFEDLVEKYQPVRGDIVYSRNASFGVAAYTDTDEAFTIGQDVVIITSNTVSNLFLYYLLNSEVFRQQLRRLSAGSTFKRINLNDIRRYKIIVPDEQEQAHITSILNHIDDRIEAETVRLSQLNVLKSALSQGLLTGRIPVKGGE